MKHVKQTILFRSMVKAVVFISLLERKDKTLQKGIKMFTFIDRAPIKELVQSNNVDSSIVKEISESSSIDSNLVIWENKFITIFTNLFH